MPNYQDKRIGKKLVKTIEKTRNFYMKIGFKKYNFD
ncbi:MAG: GNAT family N-acetyltransferase [Candidatus Aenigmarchaeota archaeon]|nr:GNAT family N-acetyltransferase [Candidatus Aenigmarchaeota archaeon]